MGMESHNMKLQINILECQKIYKHNQPWQGLEFMNAMFIALIITSICTKIKGSSNHKIKSAQVLGQKVATTTTRRVAKSHSL